MLDILGAPQGFLMLFRGRMLAEISFARSALIYLHMPIQAGLGMSSRCENIESLQHCVANRMSSKGAVGGFASGLHQHLVHYKFLRSLNLQSISPNSRIYCIFMSASIFNGTRRVKQESLAFFLPLLVTVLLLFVLW